jgi:hypothetical protein
LPAEVFQSSGPFSLAAGSSERAIISFDLVRAELRAAQANCQLRDIHLDPPRLVACQRCLGQGAGNKLWAQGFSAGVTLGAAHEAFAVRPGSFHGCRLHRKTRRSGTKLPLVHQ